MEESNTGASGAKTAISNSGKENKNPKGVRGGKKEQGMGMTVVITGLLGLAPSCPALVQATAFDAWWHWMSDRACAQRADEHRDAQQKLATALQGNKKITEECSRLQKIFDSGVWQRERAHELSLAGEVGGCHSQHRYHRLD